jgi:DNA-binding response OmpR family regulator
MNASEPGRFTKAAINSPAGEAELRLSTAGNWPLRIRTAADRDWRLACSGDLDGRGLAPLPAEPEPPLRLGPLTLDRSARRATVGEAEPQLTAREFELLATLASEPNRVFTKQELLRSIWGYRGDCRTRTLDSHASRVRVKLRSAGAPGLIVACWGVGYKLWDGVELSAAAAPQPLAGRVAR